MTAAAATPARRRVARSVHRYLGLFAGVFWLIQAITGIALTFRWEIDNELLAGPVAPLTIDQFSARIDAIARAGGKVGEVWATNTKSTRFDIFYADASGEDRVMRVDGAGAILRDRSDAALAVDSFFDTLTSIHISLLGGDAGSWIVGISGMLLLTHLVMGLRVAVPRLNVLRTALLWKPAGGLRARLYSWHRTVGLWLCVPAIIVVSAGTLLVFETGLGNAVGAEVPVPAESSIPIPTKLMTAAALRTALELVPGSRLSALAMPQDDRHPWYRIRLHAPRDIPRMWGTSTLYASAGDGRILGDYPAGGASAGRTFVESLYPVHTGQIAGFPGRAVSVALGLWFLTMIVLGLRLWRARSAAAAKTESPAS